MHGTGVLDNIEYGISIEFTMGSKRARVELTCTHLQWQHLLIGSHATIWALKV